jgi:hypothetical protein
VAALLKQQMGLELSESKTLVTPVTKRFAFLGHHTLRHKEILVALIAMKPEKPMRKDPAFEIST